MKVYLLAHTTLTLDFCAWVDNFKTYWHGEGDSCGEELCEAAAKRCYRSFDASGNKNLTKVRDKGTLKNAIESGHTSILEHHNTTWAFEGVSRVFTHELVRHRVGCAYSQESLRYCRIEDFEIAVPECLNKDARRIFDYTVEAIQSALANMGDAMDIDSLPMPERKKITSAFRRIAPMGLKTGIVCTFNMRALRHIMIQRTSIHAEAEIREVFKKVWNTVVEKWPLLVQDLSMNAQGELTSNA